MSAADDGARWRRLSALFDRALDLDPDARRVLLDAECADDPALRRELDAMLAADADAAPLDAGAGGFVDAGALAARADASDEDARDAIGGLLGHWRLERVLGSGGMGTVYAARRDDRDSGQRAAVKRLHRRWDGSLQAQRFLQERRILAALSHPHIPRLIDHGTDADARPWFALEFVDGPDLVAWCDAQRLDLRARVALFRGVCAAVQHAHERFVVHRDLKPANILVDRGGHPKVLDFGVAKRIDDLAGATRTGMFAGFTPEYAAPEQFAGGVITAATDVHALGVILFQLLAGQLPYRFDQDNLRAAAETVTARTAERMDRALATGTPDEIAARTAQRGTTTAAFRRFVRGDLTRIVQTALAKEPERRYASVQAFSTDLQRFLEGRTVSVVGDTLGYRARKFARRNRWGVAMAALALATAAVGVGGVLVQTRHAQQAAAQAERSAALARTEQRRAQAEAARATASRDFLASLLGEASPEKSGGEDTTVRQLLDRARARIDTDFVDQPELRVEMMTLIASTYADLSRYEDGKALLRKAVATADADPHIAATVRANAHAEYAFSLISDSKAPQAETEAAKAVALLRTQPDGEALVSALGTLGTAQYLQEKFAAALDAQREAARLTAKLDGGDSDAYAEALLELSYFLDGAQRADDAVAEAGKAVAILERRHPDGRDPAVSRALWAFGSALCSAGRAPDALAPLRRALAQVDAIYGKRTLKYMRSLQLLGRAELGAGLIGEATAHLERAAALVAAQAPDHPIATLLDISLGEAQLRGGSTAAAIRTLRGALAKLADNPANATARIDNATILLARAYDAAGAPDDAVRVLSPRIVSMRGRDTPQLAAALTTLATSARLRGDRSAAATALAEARPLVEGKGLPMARAEFLLEAARVAAADGDPPKRRALAAQARDLLAAHGMERSPEFTAASALAR